MSLNTALSIAQSGLSLVQRQIAQSADNIANSGTAGYTTKTVAGRTLTAGGQSTGVRSLQAQRSIDTALAADLNSARSSQAAAGARATILQGIDQVQGDPEDGQSVGDLTADLHTAFVTLRDSPSEQILQQNVVDAASTLADRYNEVSDAITSARQSAHDGMVDDVATLNSGLRQVATLNAQIVSLKAQGLSTATLQDQRDTAVAGIADVLEVKAIAQDSGAISLIAKGGLNLPLSTSTDAFQLDNAAIGVESYHGTSTAGVAGSIPGVMLAGVDVTSQLGGGRLAAYADLRDNVLPLQQAELDLSAANLATRLDAQGLTLFTGSDGSVPDATGAYSDATGGVMGFAGAMRVNGAVLADSSTVRDGTHDVAGSVGGASTFTANSDTGPAGFTTLIDRALDYSFGNKVAEGVSQPGFATTGLGPDGTLQSSLGTAKTVEDYAARLVARHTGESSAATTADTSAQALVSGLEERFSTRSSVDVDAELASMVSLQNTYAANARVMSTVQSMYDALFAVNT